MKIVKFYAVTIFAVISMLLYIHQHVEIMKLNYVVKDNEIKLAQLLDQKEALMYNIEKLENPSLLEEKLQRNGNTAFTIPEKWHMVKLGKPKKKLEIASSSEEKRSIFDFLVPKALAQTRSAR